MATTATRPMTPEEYLVWEREQTEKHEYFNGRVFAMAGGSARHNALCVSVSGTMRTALLARGCTVLSSDQRVKIWSQQRYVYPDVTVVCGRLEIESNDVLVNPTTIVEVLSKSTEGEDRGGKWDSYRRIPSLVDYVIVSQAKARIEHFRRAPDGSWIYRAADPGESITLSTEAVLIVDEIFAGVFELPGDDVPTPPPPPS
jgi:Uma2 family endonuclease